MHHIAGARRRGWSRGWAPARATSHPVWSRSGANWHDSATTRDVKSRSAATSQPRASYRHSGCEAVCVRVLMLGGGTFVGRALVDAAVAGGHEVTTFNRTTAPPAGVEELHGDRTTPHGLDQVAAREWDIVFDTWSGAPRVVRQSVSVLRERTGYYGYVSTASVYDEPGLGSDESHPTVDADPDADATDYAADKRGAELAILDGFGETALPASAGRDHRRALREHRSVGVVARTDRARWRRARTRPRERSTAMGRRPRSRRLDAGVRNLGNQRRVHRDLAARLRRLRGSAPRMHRPDGE